MSNIFHRLRSPRSAASAAPSPGPRAARSRMQSPPGQPMPAAAGRAALGRPRNCAGRTRSPHGVCAALPRGAAPALGQRSSWARRSARPPSAPAPPARSLRRRVPAHAPLSPQPPPGAAPRCATPAPSAAGPGDAPEAAGGRRRPRRCERLPWRLPRRAGRSGTAAVRFRARGGRAGGEWGPVPSPGCARRVAAARGVEEFVGHGTGKAGGSVSLCPCVWVTCTDGRSHRSRSVFQHGLRLHVVSEICDALSAFTPLLVLSARSPPSACGFPYSCAGLLSSGPEALVSPSSFPLATVCEEQTANRQRRSPVPLPALCLLLGLLQSRVLCSTSPAPRSQFPSCFLTHFLSRQHSPFYTLFWPFQT